MTASVPTERTTLTIAPQNATILLKIFFFTSYRFLHNQSAYTTFKSENASVIVQLSMPLPAQTRAFRARSEGFQRIQNLLAIHLHFAVPKSGDVAELRQRTRPRPAQFIESRVVHHDKRRNAHFPAGVAPPLAHVFTQFIVIVANRGLLPHSLIFLPMNRFVMNGVWGTLVPHFPQTFSLTYV